ncbi:hypothetical protein FRC15_010837, partial [Serendipita sp. 397]
MGLSSSHSSRLSPRTRTHHHSHHPYRSSSRQSTASSSAEGDGDDDYQQSDYDWQSGEGRDSESYLVRRYSMGDDSGGRELERATSFRSVGGYVGSPAGRRLSSTEALSTAPSTTLSSPNTSSPVFSFSSTHSLRTNPTALNYSRPFYPPPSPAMSPAITQSPRAQAQNQPSSPLSLDSLPSYPADQKPPFSYPVLIRLAILGSPQKRLLLSQIYSAIEEKFPWYKESAPKAWKASVRHCLSLNKEFVRMQRAVEDPGVGCGGWWSVDEGTKGSPSIINSAIIAKFDGSLGLKRPRKRRPAQSKRGDDAGSGDNTPSEYAEPTAPDHGLEYSPGPSLQRRYSVSTESYAQPVRDSPTTRLALPVPLSSFASPSPISGIQHQDRNLNDPSAVDYSLRLPPILVSDTPPVEQQQWRSPPAQQREHSHTPTASTSSSLSSYSTNSHSGFSERSEASGGSFSSGHSAGALGGRDGGKRSNPMNISSLLNEQLRLPKEDADAHRGVPPMKDGENEVEMRDEAREEDVSMMIDGMTPFSSEQTIRPASSRKNSPPPTMFATSAER